MTKQSDFANKEQGAESTDLSPASEPSTSNEQLTPLGGCILVDYRLGSRSRLREYITKMQMFETVYELGSVHECLATLEQYDIHACVFGPSIRPERVQDFIRAAKENGREVACAFIVSKSRSHSYAIEGVHEVFDFSTSRPEFNVVMVRALIQAHGGQLPEAARTHPVTGQPIPLRDSIEKLEYPQDQDDGEARTSRRLSTWPRETFDLVSKNSGVLRQKLNELQPFHLKFRPDGTPTEFTSEKVACLIESIFPEAETVPGMAKFKCVLEELLYKWAQIGSQRGRRTANTCLKREIINCFGLSMQ
jgi:hypothetical protein